MHQLLNLTSVSRGASYLPALLVSVTTESAIGLYPDIAASLVWVGKLTAEDGDAFISNHNIGAILDVSHPFATEISQLAIALAQHHDLPYLRYERTQINNSNPDDWLDTGGRSGNIVLPQLAPLFADGYLRQERTLLILGYRMLPDFKPHQSQGILYARILPSSVALTAALAAGFTPDRIIALRPPISPQLEKALWQQWQITQVVIKASGQVGGESQKQTIASELGVRLIRLARPFMLYPNQTDGLETALDFAMKHYL